MILVTGGTGYIGSHTVVQLLNSGHEVVVVDNLSNSKAVVIDRIKQITGKSPFFFEGDINDNNLLRRVFSIHRISAVIHFAGLKAVGESESQPLKYYENNVAGSMTLFKEMAAANVKKIIFSSSATVYGNPDCVQYFESMPLQPINVYGRTKLMVEEILKDLKASDNRWRVALLRYFNPVGAHKSGLIGEDPCGKPNNLMPFISQVAIGVRDKVFVYGNDYPTSDGTGVRDYIHVEDLARGHVEALNRLEMFSETLTLNLGTGRPHSVLEVISAFERACSKKIPYEIVDRRLGDLPAYYANPALAEKLLGWNARSDINKMCEDVWRWQLKNPKGY